MDHDELLEAAKDAAGELFGDTSVSRGTTRKSMEDLIGHIQSMVDTIDRDEG